MDLINNYYKYSFLSANFCLRFYENNVFVYCATYMSTPIAKHLYRYDRNPNCTCILRHLPITTLIIKKKYAHLFILKNPRQLTS